MQFVPRPYQAPAIKFLLDTPKAGLFLDVGLGKSVCTSVVIQTTLLACEVHHWLIVAPLKVCQTTWPSEFAKWDHLQGISVNHLWGLSEKDRLLAVRRPADVTVINFDQLVWLIRYWGKKWPYRGVVLDESSKLKDSDTKRWHTMRRVLPFIERLIELTGSPVAQGYIGLWAQVYLLDHGAALGRTLGGYRLMFFDSDFHGYKWTPKEGATDIIEDSIRHLCMTMRAVDHLDLPPVLDNVIEVPLPPSAAKQYAEMEKAEVLRLKGMAITAVNAGVLTNKLSQIANGVIYHANQSEEHGEYTLLHNAKIEALADMIDGMNGHPFLLAYWFKSDKARLREKFKPETLEFFDGTDAQMARWQRGEIPVLAVHPASGGHGVDGLQAATNVVVWLFVPWSRELYDQFNGRVIGARQLGTKFEKQCGVVHHLVARGTIDETAMVVLKMRGSNQEDFLNALRHRFA